MARQLSRACALALCVLCAALSGMASAQTAADHDRALAIADALVGLREVAGLSISPSGRYAAFEVRRGDPDANVYRSEWRVLSLDSPRDVRVVAEGGEPPWGRFRRTGRPTMVWITLAARWSPDEQWIAYLKRENGGVQIWRSRIDGTLTERVTDDEGDVVDFVWSADGGALIYDAGPSRAALDAALVSERREGFLLDGRFDPVTSWEPIRFTSADAPDPPCCRAIELTTGRTRAASAAEIARFRRERPANAARLAIGGAHMWTARAQGDSVETPSFGRAEPRHTRWRKRLASGGAVAFALADPALAGLEAPVRLHARTGRNGRFVACQALACAGILVDAWALSSGEIAFARREGWANSRLVFYAWRPRTGAVREVLSTHDLWYDCDQVRDRLVCFTEGSTAPQALAALDLVTGEISTLHELNPDFDSASLIQPERLEWTSPGGLETFGYFLAPPGPRPEHGWPLVIVQYRASGFLRGGTGDFSPVQAYAAAGLAVLVVDRPEDWDLRARIADDMDIARENWRGLGHRRDVFASIEAAIDLLAARGVVDVDRVGISGLSDGAATTAFAIGHSHRFRAASISGGSWEPILFAMSAPQQRAWMETLGLGAPRSAGDLNWDGISIARNAARITTPLLIQTADRELGMMVEPLAMLQTHGRAVEAYVFSDEYHVMWQPAHRLAMYRRNLDWFRFWLQDHEDRDPRKAPQYERWRAMRAGPETG